MEFGQLKCFLALAREGNFTRAAKACHMTQPSLSYQIARLEEEVGQNLFLRKPRAVTLSEAGKQLLESAALMVGERERVLARFRKRTALLEGELRFGIIPTMAPYLLPPLLEAFRRDCPAIGVVARESRTSQLVKEVVADELEFAIVSDVEASTLKRYSLHLSPLFEERLIMAAPELHASAGLPFVAPSSVDQAELILLSEGNCLRDQTMKLCGSDGRPSALVCEQLPTQLAMVAAGLGVAVVPEMAVRQGASWQGVSFVPFEDPSPLRLIGLLKKRGRKLGGAAAEFVRRLRESDGG